MLRFFVSRTLRGESTAGQLDSVWKELQTHVDHVIDRWDLKCSIYLLLTFNNIQRHECPEEQTERLGLQTVD